MILDSRQFIMEDVARRGAACGGLAYPINVPMLASFRMSRRLVGTRTLRERDCHRWFDDTLGLTGDWRKPGPVYSLPLSILTAVRTPNLITAGRCISCLSPIPARSPASAPTPTNGPSSTPPGNPPHLP